jgi:hypothetical protein
MRVFKMAAAIVRYFWRARRFLLMKLVPEWIWPENIHIDGVDIAVRHAPYSFATKYILVRRRYEVPERNLLRGIIASGDMIFEMGGSIGILTAILGEMAGPQGKVFSVEASGKLTSWSKSWLEKKGNIHVLTGFGFPVYDAGNSIKIISFDESAGALAGVVSFEQVTARQKDALPAGKIYDIKTMMLAAGVSPNVLVVDIEGREKAVLFDGIEWPDSIRFFLVELHPRIYGEKIKAHIIGKIKSLGFLVLSYEADTYLFKRS